MEQAILMGPFVGELYWEAARFAPMLPYMMQKEFKGKDIKYVIFTREDRFDLYGNYADIFVPLRIEGDYSTLQPNCFRLNGLSNEQYQKMANKFNRKYSEKFKILKHVYPSIIKGQFLNKNQFRKEHMIFDYSPRLENYLLVESYIPNDKPIVVLAPRYRNGFKRNWKYWKEFYDMLFNSNLMSQFNFVVCGKRGEYIPDEKDRFFDINHIALNDNSSLIGILLVILEKAFFTFGSQSSIPNLSLLYKVEVLEFGCQKTFHTKTYNIFNTPITFIENRDYDLDPKVAFDKLNHILVKRMKGKSNESIDV